MKENMHTQSFVYSCDQHMQTIKMFVYSGLEERRVHSAITNVMEI